MQLGLAAHRPHRDGRGLVRRRHHGPHARSCCRSRRRSPAPSPAASRSAPAASGAAARRASASCAPTSTPSRRSRASRARKGSRRGVWDGRVAGAPAPPGIYMVVVRVRDRSGNVGTAPAVLPPVPGQVRGKPGITVRQVTAQPPVEPVRAGERVQFFVDSRRRAYRWTVRRVGASRPIKKGRGAPGKTLSLRAPRGISGAYLLQIRSGRYARQRAVPRAGAGAREAAGRHADAVVAGRRQGRRRQRRAAEHARDRRPGGVAARDQRRPGHPAGVRRRDRAAARLPRPRADPLRPDLGHRARALARPARDRPRGRHPRRLAALGPAPAGAPAAPLRRRRRAARELRDRVAAPRRADRQPTGSRSRRSRRRPTRSARGSSRWRTRAPRTTAARRCR